MKAWMLGLASGGLGLAVGAGIAWSEFAGASLIEPGVGRAPTEQQTAVTVEPSKDVFPIAVVEGGELRERSYVHDFGTMELGKTGSFTFVVRNDGTAPLTLKKGHFTCTCTLGKLEKDIIPPGESTKIVLEWTPKEFTDHFLTEGDFHTNDPAASMIRLGASGNVVRAVRVKPDELSLDAVSANEPVKTQFSVFDYRGADFVLEPPKLAKPETSQFYEIETETLSPEQLALEGGALAGVTVTVTIKPGLPLGPINQRILLKSNRADVGELAVVIQGKVVGDITLLGPGYENVSGIVKLGSVAGGQGTTKTLQVMVKGPRRHETQVKVGNIRPKDVLQATLGEPRQVNNGAVIMIPLEIKVPADAPLGDHLGTKPGTLGLIELETTDPQAQKVLVYVSFLVEKVN